MESTKHVERGSGERRAGGEGGGRSERSRSREERPFAIMRAIVFSALELLTISTSTSAFATQRHFYHDNDHKRIVMKNKIRRTVRGRCYGQKPSWIDDAMGGMSQGPLDDDGDDRISDLSPGLAGFTLSEEGGFFAILVSPCAQCAVPVLVSPSDKDRVTSPEATTMVQLAGGLDLGTAVLPPDALMRLVANELEEDDGGDDDAASTMKNLRQSRIQLSKVRAVRASEEESSAGGRDHPPDLERAGARNPAVQESFVDKVSASIKGLPGLQDATREQVEDAVHFHADESGNLDRSAFSDLLQTVRSAISPAAENFSNVAFVLSCTVISGNNVQEIEMRTASAVTAIGLALRNKVDIDVSHELVENLSEEVASESIGDAGAAATALPVSRILDQFPAFRPLSELREDAKIMDGFIPSMFARATDITNDDKAQ